MNYTIEVICFRCTAMKSTAIAVGLITLCLLTLSCASWSPPGQSPLDAEARQKGEEYWYGDTLTKCGDSYYAKDDSYHLFYQFNDVSIEMKPTPLTEASRLNGVEWSGFASLRCKTSRMGVKNLKWEEWKNGSVYPAPSVPIKKVNGKWFFSDQEKPKPFLKKIDCSEVD